MLLQVTDVLTFLLFSSSAIRLLLKSLKTLPNFSPPLCPRVRVPCFRLHHTRTQFSVLTICSKYLLSCTKHFKPWLKIRIPFILITNPGFDWGWMNGSLSGSYEAIAVLQQELSPKLHHSHLTSTPGGL